MPAITKVKAHSLGTEYQMPGTSLMYMIAGTINTIRLPAVAPTKLNTIEISGSTMLMIYEIAITVRVIPM